MIDSIQNIIQPVLVEVILAAAVALFGFLNRKLPARHRLELEQRHRDALHQAINTGIGLAIDTVQKHPAVAPTDQAIGAILDYVEASVPDALRHLAPTRAHLERMARAKLQQQVDAIMGRDRLTEALNTIPGIAAVKPQG